MRKSLCFKCGESNHFLQPCPSSAWSDPRDWNILSRRGRRIRFSRDFLKSRYSLQQLMDHLAHGCHQPPRNQPAHQQVSKPKVLQPRICYNCRQPGLMLINDRTLSSTSPNSRIRTPEQLKAITARSRYFKWSKASLISWVTSLYENTSLLHLLFSNLGTKFFLRGVGCDTPGF
jgi:hypothetical protein